MSKTTRQEINCFYGFAIVTGSTYVFLYCTDTLTAKNLGVMLTEVLDWHKLGTKLDLPGHSLAEIRMDYNVHGTDRQRQEMIGKWLAFDTEASWSKLAGALEEMGEKTAAKSIRDKYVPHCGGT